ncbi:MAG: B12-binding domain-containing radical SAM protein [Candidatus Aureabacteria bacterium]|nr:B12-binding domain-containing radical SAM protein [Candidatus Auribacterota bacterium]
MHNSKKMKKVAFIYVIPPVTKSVYTGYHHGLASLSAVLKRSLKTSNRLFILEKSCITKMSMDLKDFGPELVLVTSCSGQIQLAKAFLEAYQKSCRKPFVIVGGPHATALPEETLRIGGVDSVCVGEGEAAVADFAPKFFSNENYTETPGLWFKTPDKNIIRNDPSPFLHPDDLPFPDRELFDFQSFINAMPHEVGPEFMGSRGCVFNCSYCATGKIHGAGVRLRSPGKLIQEIRSVTESYSGIKIIGFHDNIFTLDKEWLREFCERYRKEVAIPYWCNTRVDCLTEDDVKWLKRSKCRRIHMGIESGSERIRRDILGRFISNRSIQEAFQCVKRHGIKAVAFNMIGLPTETEDDIMETILLNRAIRPSWIILSIFQPYPGTDIYPFCVKKPGVSEGASEDYYSCQKILEQTSVSTEKVKYYFSRFIPQVYDS